MLKAYDAIAHISPSRLAPDVRGTVKFLKADEGTWVEAEIFGLPDFSEGSASSPQKNGQVIPARFNRDKPSG